jgi:hypothetical protein
MDLELWNVVNYLKNRTIYPTDQLDNYVDSYTNLQQLECLKLSIVYRVYTIQWLWA